MLKAWMWNGRRRLSQSGRCWTSAISATSSGGSSSAAGSRKTAVVWYDWFPGVTTTNSCAVATPAASTANVIQPCVCWERRVTNGNATTSAAVRTSQKYAEAKWERPEASPVSRTRSRRATSLRIALMPIGLPGPPLELLRACLCDVGCRARRRVGRRRRAGVRGRGRCRRRGACGRRARHRRRRARGRRRARLSGRGAGRRGRGALGAGAARAGGCNGRLHEPARERRRVEAGICEQGSHVRRGEECARGIFADVSEAIQSLGDAVPGDAIPGGAVPRDAVPGRAVPGRAIPGGAVPGGAVPGCVRLRRAVPGGAVEAQPACATGRRAVDELLERKIRVRWVLDGQCVRRLNLSHSPRAPDRRRQ